jgi:hypothetical protein
MRTDRRPAATLVLMLLLPGLVAAALAASACSRGSGIGPGSLVKQYEYEEDVTLSLDGSARIDVNASIPALVNMRGFDLNTKTTALLDRNRIKDLFTAPGVHVLRISSWRRFGRRFVQVRLAVDDVRTLGTTKPFSWATYQLQHKDGLVVYRQVLGAAVGRTIDELKLRGNEMVAFRLHIPSRIRYHNAGEGNLRRGNILVWEQEFAARQIGSPLEIEARFDETSILRSTLVLFAWSGLLAILVLVVIIWWVVKRGGHR